MWTSCRAQRELGLADSTVRSLDGHLRDVDVRYRVEQVPRTDLLAAQVSLANAQQTVIQARNRLDSSRAGYNRHLSRPLIAAVRLAELPLNGREADVDGLTALAFRLRPDLTLWPPKSSRWNSRPRARGPRTDRK